MKHEWKKDEKQFYLPGNKPEFVTILNFKFYMIEGEGNPNDDHFAEYVGVLYALSYGIKMSSKKGFAPKGYFEYAVYPLEGVWDLNEEGRKTYDGTINKNHLVFKLMIRQPDFVDQDFALVNLELTKKKKPHALLDHIKFEEMIEGDCIQMMHLGSYDSEPESFKIMESFADQENYFRKLKTHREIYLNDARKVAPDQLKTVLRFSVGKT